MKILISLAVAIFVIALNLLISQELTPDLNLDMAVNILFMTFVGTAVITSLLLKYRRGRTAMTQRIPILLGIGMADFAFLYLTCIVPSSRMLVTDAVINMGVSAFLASVVTFTLLYLPAPLSDEWRRAIISLGFAFFAALFINVQIICFAEEAKNLKLTFASVFICTAVFTSLVLRHRGR